MILADKIILLRKKCGWSQEQLAEQLDISRQSVSKWENNTNMPDILLLPIIADIFEVSIDALYGRLNPKGPMEAEAVLERCCESIINNIELHVIRIEALKCTHHTRNKSLTSCSCC